MRLRPFFLLLALPFAACSCEDTPLAPVSDASIIRCTKDEDCAARERCRVEVGLCIPRDQCGPDRPCPEGRECVDENMDGFTECVFERCEDDDECAMTMCPPGELPACNAGGCTCGIPCNGGCPPGRGCCFLDDVCYDLPEQCMGLICPPGQIVSVTSSGAWDTGSCMFSGETCECERLPPLPIGDIGLYSAMAHDGATPILSAYNLTYGDLMFGVTRPDGTTIDWEFVDGVPTSSRSITGDVDGPRGGNSEPGEDVGIHSDIASDAAGRAFITYASRDEGDLKLALGVTGAWDIHDVATDGESVYASIALDTAGRPRISYLAVREEGPAPNQRRSVLRLAVATSSTPSSSSDWIIREIEATSLVPFGCAEQCRVDEVCRMSTQSCVRPDSPSRCTPACSSSERCIQQQCVAITPLPPFRDLPMARGLFTSNAALADGTVLIAYYDRIDLGLKIARIAGPDPAVGAISVRTLEGGTGDEDVGLFPSLFVTPGGEIHLAYLHATRRELIYRLLDGSLNTVLREVIESGVNIGMDPAGHLIGADPALVVDANGVVRVAYQDATAGDLKYARRTGGWGTLVLRGNEAQYEGSFGFYSDQIIGPDRRSPLISTYRFWLSAPNGPQNGLVLVTPP